MQSQQHYSLLRRILFPYSGQKPLTRMQGIRVILTWGIFFSFLLSLCTLPMILLLSMHTLTGHRLSGGTLAELMLIAFLSGIVIFGMLGWLVVAMSNRAARIIQRRNMPNAPNASQSSTNGGRYGS